MRGLLAAVVAMLVCVGGAWGAEGEAYAIKLHRPGKVGTTYDLVRTKTMSRAMEASVGGEVTRRDAEERELTLEGRVTVLEVNAEAAGRASKLKVVVKRLVDAKGNEYLPAGAELTVERAKDGSTFSLKEGEVSDAAKDVLKRFYGPAAQRKETDDDTMGTKERKRVGESWSVDANATAREAEESDVAVDPKDISGKVTLKGAENVGGVACLRLSGELVAKGARPKGMPAGVTVKSATMSGSMEVVLPVDGELPEADRSLTTKYEVTTVATQGGKEVETRVSGTVRDREKVSGVKK